MEFDAVNYAAIRNVHRVLDVREASGSQTSANSTWTTLVSLTATKGWIFMLRGTFNTTATTPQFRVTIDGGTPMTFTLTQLGTLYRNSSFALPLSKVRFESSVLIEYQQASATATSATAGLIWGSR